MRVSLMDIDAPRALRRTKLPGFDLARNGLGIDSKDRGDLVNLEEVYGWELHGDHSLKWTNCYY